MNTPNQQRSAQELADGMVPFAPDWEIAVSDDYNRNIRVALPGGAGLLVSVSPYNHKRRVVVSGNYPPQYYGYGRERVGEITVALSRGPEAIVKEIARRLLPAYLPSYAEAMAKIAADDDYKAKKDAALKELADVLGVEPSRETAYYFSHVDGMHFRARVKYVSNGSADLELTVPKNLALEILAMVVAASKAE